MTSLDAVPTLVLIAAIAVVSPLIAELTKRGAGMLSVVLLPMLALRRLRSVSPDQGAGPAIRAPG